MKQIILLSCVFLYSTFSIAQKTIKKEDFEHLVDYANCKYVQAFIEQNDTGKPYYTDIYKVKVKPELEKVSLANFTTILNFGKLEELLSDNTLVLELAKKINDRKSKFDKFKDDESLISSLKAKSWGKIDLNKTAIKLQSEIFKKYNLAQVSKISKEPEKKVENAQKTVASIQDNDTAIIKESESKVENAQTIVAELQNLKLKMDSLEQQYKELRDNRITGLYSSFNSFRIIFFVVIGFLIIVNILIYFLLKNLLLREYIIKQVIESKRIEEKFNPKNKNQPNNITKSYTLNEKDIDTIVDRVLECKRLNEKETHQQQKPTINENIEPSKSSVKYLKGKSGKIFNRIDNSPENSFFRLYNETENTALFEFYGNEAEAIAKRIFSEDICNIVSGSYQNAHSVKTNKPGKIKRLGDQWEVTELIEINLI